MYCTCSQYCNVLGFESNQFEHLLGDKNTLGCPWPRSPCHRWLGCLEAGFWPLLARWSVEEVPDTHHLWLWRSQEDRRERRGRSSASDPDPDPDPSLQERIRSTDEHTVSTRHQATTVAPNKVKTTSSNRTQ